METKKELQIFAINLFNAKKGGRAFTSMGLEKRLRGTQRDIERGKLKTFKGVERRFLR